MMIRDPATHHAVRRKRIAGVPEPPPLMEERPIRVLFTDRQTDETKVQLEWGTWERGEFDASPWMDGILACDCARLALMYGPGDYPCGSERVRVRILDDGDTPIYAEE